MKQKLYLTYFEGLKKAQDCTDEQLPLFEEFYKIFNLKMQYPHLSPYRYYIVDYVNCKYIYLDAAHDQFLGYPTSFLKEAGPLFYISLWNKNDFDIYNNQIFPDNLKTLNNYTTEQQQNLVFCHNYRIKHKNGTVNSILQRSNILLSKEGVPLAGIGIVFNMTSMLPTNKITHTIEFMDDRNDFMSPEIIHLKIYFPDETDGMLTKREIEVLKWVFEGLSSKQIADKLNISIFTINNHRQNMLEKTNSRNSTELLKYSILNGVI